METANFNNDIKCFFATLPKYQIDNIIFYNKRDYLEYMREHNKMLEQQNNMPGRQNIPPIPLPIPPPILPAETL